MFIAESPHGGDFEGQVGDKTKGGDRWETTQRGQNAEPLLNR